jgi:hypothetical protein
LSHCLSTANGERMIPRDNILEIRDKGYRVLKGHFPRDLIDACREAFWPVLMNYLEKHRDQPNRGPHRHFVPMPFSAPCFAPEFFFDPTILAIARKAMDDRIVADQWGCDTAVRGSAYQQFHADYQRPLFPETPDLALPPYVLVVSFGLVAITSANGPIEIAAGTHRTPREQALRAIESGECKTQTVPLQIGDVLIRHPWALHRGTPNATDIARPLVTIRYVRRWYADDSRDVNQIPRAVWNTLSPEQQAIMRFPLEDR